MALTEIPAAWLPGGPPGDDAPPIATGDVAASYEEDAARSRGSAAGVVRARSESDVVALLRWAERNERTVVAQGARSSLTAGATPRGDVVLALEELDRILEVKREGAAGFARVEPGVRLATLNERLASEGLWFPPVPTYDLCCAGGAVATNAAGAATFKHGPVRPWVRALRAVLASGRIVDVRRGQCLAGDEGFLLEGRRVPLPRYRTPDVKKIACGYFVRDRLDLVDLLVGSEGTLAVVTGIELALASVPGAVVAGLAAFPDEPRALAFTADLRAASEEAWRTRDPDLLDVRSIEWIDAASVELLRTRGKTPDGVTLPRPGGSFVLWEQELAIAPPEESALADLASGLGGAPARGPLAALGRLLAKHGASDDAILALPGDERGRERIARLREVVPETVNELVAERKRADPGVRKVAGDMVVPPERLPEMIAHYRRAFEARGLACAIWGHVSDGNVHPNVLARSAADARAGDEALLELGDLAKSLGGAPLSEHGVGKSATKQELVRRFYGDAAIADMARLKRAFDPRGVLAPGNIFPRELLRSLE